MINHVQALKSGIVRFHHSNGAVVGAGFLVSDCNILTCAHVVAAALGISPNTPELPLGLVEMDFPLVAPGEKFSAQVIFWNPVNPEQSVEDIAGLELLQPLPQQVGLVSLTSLQDHWGHSMRTFGFPKGHDPGLWVTGILRDQSANGWVQLDALASQDRPIEPGFSGAPIWDEQLQGVVGMAVAAEKRRSNVTSAYMIPTSILQTAWSSLEVQASSSSTDEILSGFSKVKFTSLKKREDVLLKQYEAAYNQMNYELADANKIAIQEQIKAIDLELQQVISEISELLP